MEDAEAHAQQREHITPYVLLAHGFSPPRAIPSAGPARCTLRVPVAKLAAAAILMGAMALTFDAPQDWPVARFTRGANLRVDVVDVKIRSLVAWLALPQDFAGEGRVRWGIVSRP